MLQKWGQTLDSRVHAKNVKFQRPFMFFIEYNARENTLKGKKNSHAAWQLLAPFTEYRGAGCYLQDPHGNGFQALDVLPQRGAS